MWKCLNTIKKLPSKNETYHKKLAMNNKLSIWKNVLFYIHLLLVIWQLDNHNNDATLLGDCIESANALVTRLQKWSERRGIDQFQAKAYFFQCQAVCAAGISCQTLFNFWHQAIKTSILRSNVHSQACLYNLLLRCYLNQQQYEQADKFMQKTDFPKQADNNQWSRYFYGKGREKFWIIWRSF